jgi:hypothetical protein
LFLFSACYAYSQADSITSCRFYTYNGEHVFKLLDDNTQEVNFIIKHNPDDGMAEKAMHFLGLKKGIHTFNVNQVKENEITVSLKTSPLFDAHYLRLILERNLNIPQVFIDDTHTTWDDFEKSFLKKATNY